MRVASLEIELIAGISRLQSDMSRATGVVSKSMGAIEKSVEQAKRALGSLGLGLGFGAAVSQVIQLSDSYTKFTAQLKLATTSQREYAQAYSDVQRISKVAQAEIGATGVLYARVANGTRELGIGMAKVSQITEATNLALKVSGATTSESASATLQLSQAFASGVLRGEEFNAVNEVAPRLMKALADGMRVPVGALREMATEGKITSQVMAEALPKALAELREEAKSVETIGGAFTVLKNAVLEFVGTQSQASGFVSVLTSGIGLLANNLQLLIGVIATVGAAQLAQWMKKVTVETYGNVVANQARLASTVAAAQADIAATAATAAQATATQAMIVVAREDAIAKLAGANANVVSAKAALSAAQAVGAHSFALRAQRIATGELAAAEAGRLASLAALATLGRQQAAVSAQITAADLAQAAAKNTLTGATAAASLGARVATSALGLLGGPVGLLTTAVIGGYMAWNAYKESADKVKQSLTDLGQPIDDVVAKFQKLTLVEQSRALAGLASAVEKAKTDMQQAFSDLGNVPLKLRVSPDFGTFKAELKALSESGLGVEELDRKLNSLVGSFLKTVPGSTSARAAVENFVIAAVNAQRATDGLNQRLEQLGSTADEAAESSQRLAVAAARAAQGLAPEKWDQYIKALEKSATVAGMSAQQLAEYEAKTAGASAAQAQLAGVLAASEQAAKNLQKATEDKDTKAKNGADTILGAFVAQEVQLRVNIRRAQEYASLLAMGLTQSEASKYSQGIAEGAQGEYEKQVVARVKAIRENIADGTGVYKKAGGTGAADKQFKDALAARVDAIKNAQTIEIAQYESTAATLEAIYKRGDVSSRTYYSERISMMQTSTKAQQDAILKEIEVLNAGDKAGKTHAETLKKIADAETALSVMRMKDATEIAGLREDEANALRAIGFENIKSLEDQTRAGLEQTKSLREQAQEFGLTADQVNALRLARIDERIAAQQSLLISADTQAKSKDEIRAIEEKIAALNNLKTMQGGQNAAEAVLGNQREWEKAVDQYGDVFRTGFADMLNNGKDGWKSFTKSLVTTFKTSVVDQLYKMFLQPFIVKIVASLSGIGQGGVTGAAGGANGGGFGNIMGSVSNIQSLYSSATGSMASTMAGAAASVGSTIGSSAMTSFAAGMQGSTLAAGLAGPTTAGATGAMGVGQAVGAGASTYLPYVGALFAASQGQYATAAGTAIGTAILPGIGTAVGALAGMLIDNFVGSQAEVRGGGQYGYSFDGTVQDNRAGRTLTGVDRGANFLQGPSGGELASDQVKSVIDSTVSSINGIFSAVGSQVTLSGFWGGLETSDKGRGGVMSGGQLSTGAAFGEDGTGSVYGGKKIFESFSTRSPDAEEAVSLFVEDLYQSTIQALQAASGELPETIRAMVAGVDAESLSAESAQALVAQVSATIAAVNQMRLAFEALPFENLKNLSFGATSALLEFGGGVEAFTTSLGTYFTNFYSQEEQFTAKSKDIATALSSIGVAMPELTGSADQVKAAYRAIVDSFDVTTESGQRAYATMVTLSGSFAELTGVMDQLNTASAHAAENERQLALQAAESGRQKAQQDAQDLASSLMDAFTDRDGIIDVSGLSAKLKSATEQAFVQTIVQVFENLATMLEGVIDGIGNERNAVQSAIKQVQNIGVMTPGAIAREISSINTAMPANAGVVAAYGQLSAADALLAQRKQQESSAGAQYNAAQSQYNAGQESYNAAQAQMGAAQSALGSAQEQAIAAQTRQAQAQHSADAARDRVAQLERDINGPKTVGYKSAGWSALNAAREAALPQIDAERGAFQQAQAEAQAAQQAAAAYQTQLQQAQGAAHQASQGAGAAGPGRAVVDQLAAQYAAAVTATAQAQAAATAAVEGARQSQVDYANAVQAFTINSGKSVGKLTELRGETMRYYEAQKALADLMKNSAATLRKTALDYRVSQLDPEDQFAHLRGEFDKAYALALSTDGEDLVGYADQLNSMLTPLLAQANDVYATESGLKSFIATALARVENIAGRTDLLAPKNYEADSLALLNQIDATLAALDKSAKSAETIIAEAINSSRDSLLGGLRQIANALVGNPVAAFASGGYHTGGLRLVGERGPELEVTGPSRIYNANQTRSMLSGSGDSSEVVAELRALRAEVADLRIEARATASNTNKIAKQGDRNEQDGILIRSDTDLAVNGFV